MTTLRSVIRRNAIRIVVILTVLLLVAFKVQKVVRLNTVFPNS